MTNLPPSSGGMGSMFMTPSETESIDVKKSASVRPASNALRDMTAMPTTDVDCDTVSAAVAGLNKPATACTTMPMYMKPAWMARSGETVTCETSPVAASW